MYGPEPQALSRHFTHLINCQVTFTETTLPPKTSVKQICGVYSVFPSESALIVKADLTLLRLAGGRACWITRCGDHSTPEVSAT